MANNPHTAVILLGHGSRVPGAAGGMEQVAQRLKEKGQYSIVEVCHMSKLGPRLRDALENCEEQGAGGAIVIPYFLHCGVHMNEDIPEMMQEAAKEFPNLKIILGKHLGFDESLVGLVEKRVLESAGFEDIRGKAV